MNTSKRKILARAVAVGPIDAYVAVMDHFHGDFLFCWLTIFLNADDFLLVSLKN